MDSQTALPLDSAEAPTRRASGGHTGPRTACTNHCVSCGGHFSSLSAFDAHRRGDPDSRYCDMDVTNEQGEPLIVPKTENGSCDLKDGEPMGSGAAVYATRGWWKAAGAFRGAK